MENEKLVYILILNYNSSAETIDCVNSILNNVKYNNYKIIILDNNSSDNSCKILTQYCAVIFNDKHKEIRFIPNETNYGYAHGNNIGIKIAMEENADYVCLMNPDVLVTTDFLSELVYVANEDSGIGMLCPAGTNYGNEEYCIGAGSKIGKLTGYTKIINSGKKISNIFPKVYHCDYLGGMCILVKTEVINKIGLIPENYFLFYEETEWCIKCNNSGYKCVADTNVSVIHKGSVTIDRASKGKINLHNYYMYRNRILFQKRNRNKIIYIIFLIYYLAEITYERIKGHYGKEVWMAYIDGIRNVDRLGNAIQHS